MKAVKSDVNDLRLELDRTKLNLQNLGFEVEYLDVHSFNFDEKRLFAAVNIGGVRLIDNVTID